MTRSEGAGGGGEVVGRITARTAADDSFAGPFCDGVAVGIRNGAKAVCTAARALRTLGTIRPRGSYALIASFLGAATIRQHNGLGALTILALHRCS